MKLNTENLKNFTLLYVEDDLDTQETLTEILKNDVKELYIAQNGQEGLDIYKKYSPDIVLADVTMPILDGITMSKFIREINKEQQIILLTALSNSTSLHKAINLGINKYIIKPIVDLTILFDSLESSAKYLQEKEDLKKVHKVQETQKTLNSIIEVIHNISHQWRQPLSVITANASKISVKIDLETELSNSEIYESMHTITNQASMLSKTLDDFKHFFNADNVLKREFNVQDSINQAITTLLEDAKENNIQFIQETDDYTIYQSQSQLTQSIINIIQNSIDCHMFKNIDGEKLIFIKSKSSDGNIIIEIRDNAGGIADSIIDNIFEPYVTTKHKAVGVGLGLYTANKVITSSFKGFIHVENVKYEYNNVKYIGAELSIVIPINND